MAKLKPWYQVVTPREDLRENRPLDASEFAVHLDHIREHRAHDDYVKPQRFFERTYMTKSLLDLSSQVMRRLSGIKVETSAVFNMATQFGGGKTHSLTALYHLAREGEAARHWRGVEGILQKAEVRAIPKADVAVFVGTEFDVITGRGGDGEPVRKTPWGEIAWQLGGHSAFEIVSQHDATGTAPAGDVIRKMLPSGPCLILMDELLNYVSRGRKSGISAQLYDFIQNLSEEARARDNTVLCVSIPASELEMNAEDQRDYDSYKKLLDRIGKAVSMSSDTEVNEIIRRRLFDWLGLPDDGKKTVAAYAEWAREHAQEVANLGGENPVELFKACYPFHPSVISVFERKWQGLPRFQRTRGVLRLLALWVSRAYQEEHRKASSEPLITLGTAPLDDQVFRDAVFEQLGSDQLSVPVGTDIAGKKESHAVRLDRESTEAIRKARLHQKVATIIFMESNGGQSQSKSEASLPEIRAAIGGPDVNLADLETILEGLSGTCYYLNWEKNRYRFGLRPNLNQMLVTRRGAIAQKDIDERVKQTITDLFKEGHKGLERRYFPERSNDVPDRPQLTLVVLGLDCHSGDLKTEALMESILRESGTSGRTYKSGLLFAVPDAGTTIADAARNVLAWEDINQDDDSKGQLEESQKRSLDHSLKRARSDLKEAIFRAYRHVYLLGKDNKLKDVDLGQITSSMAGSPTELIINTLLKDDEITQSVGANKLLRVWPPALKEWSTKAIRDAFFASPALPRLLDPDTIKRTIADGVSSNLFGYARKEGDRLVLERFGESMMEMEIEIADDVFLLKAEDAQKLQEPPRLDRLQISPERAEIGPKEHVTFKAKGIDQYGHPFDVEDVTWSAPGCSVTDDGQLTAGEAPGLYTVTAETDGLQAEAQVRVVEKTEESDDETTDDETAGNGQKTLRWSGTIPHQKWSNFYLKVLTKLASSQGLSLEVRITAPTDGEHAKAKAEEVKTALRELGLDEDVTVS